MKHSGLIWAAVSALIVALMLCGGCRSLMQRAGLTDDSTAIIVKAALDKQGVGQYVDTATAKWVITGARTYLDNQAVLTAAAQQQAVSNQLDAFVAKYVTSGLIPTNAPGK